MKVALEPGTSFLASRPQAADMAFSSVRTRSYLGAMAALVLLLNSRTGICCDSAACTCQSACPVNCTRQGAWFIAASDNFHVCSLQSQAHAEQMAKHCEEVRTTLTRSWRGESKPWNPKCQIVMHGSTRDYVRAVGPGSEATLGSSLVKPAIGAVRTRRIDLRTDVADYLTAALPHEMCHVVLADHFREGPAPLWFDEGVALQYDLPEKQRLHDRDLRVGLQQGTAFPLPELLTLKEYPPQDRWGVFYGQSASLVRWLLTKGTAQQLLTCIEQAPSGATNMALREGFGLHGWRGVHPSGAFATSVRRDSALRLVYFTESPAGASE